jgi:hypothetical protein
MRYGKFFTVAALAASLTVACNREPGTTAEETASSTADVERERQDAIAGLNERVAELERDYAEKNQEVKSGEKAATAGLREEIKEDVTNVRRAVDELATTTADNWWDRHEQAVRRTAEDVEADVRRLAGDLKVMPPAGPTGTTGQSPSTEPFTSRRDAFVNDLRARVDAMERALDSVKARGTKETEIEDTQARVRKLGEDLDRLRSASADDWWDVSRDRVAEYVDRVETSIGRLDDNKPATTAP